MWSGTHVKSRWIGWEFKIIIFKIWWYNLEVRKDPNDSSLLVLIYRFVKLTFITFFLLILCCNRVRWLWCVLLDQPLIQWPWHVAKPSPHAGGGRHGRCQDTIKFFWLLNRVWRVIWLWMIAKIEKHKSKKPQPPHNMYHSLHVLYLFVFSEHRSMTVCFYMLLFNTTLQSTIGFSSMHFSMN